MSRVNPAKLLATFAAVNVVLCLVGAIAGGHVGLHALIASSFFMSIMFPTIFSMSLRGLGIYTKSGSSFLVMAIIGGAVFTALMGYISRRELDQPRLARAGRLFRGGAAVRAGNRGETPVPAYRMKRSRVASWAAPGSKSASWVSAAPPSATCIASSPTRMRAPRCASRSPPAFATSTPRPSMVLGSANCGSAQALKGAQALPVISTKVGRRWRPPDRKTLAWARRLFLASPLRAGVRLRLRIGHALACREPRASRVRASTSCCATTSGT